MLKKLQIPRQKVHASFIQHLPFARTKYRNYLSLFAKAVENFDLSDYDLIISSSSCVAKGVLTHTNQIHICYCHSPVRYGWDLYFQYLHAAGLNKFHPKALYVQRVLHHLRIWDVISSNRVNHFISNSDYIRKRIFNIYRREALTIYPPVNTKDFDYNLPKEDYFFTCSRMVPYKKIDLIVTAFASMPKKKLIVIGSGPEYSKIEKLKTPNIELLGYQSFDVLKNYMERARAFVFAAEEDFGIVLVEAQACGVPVIAFGKGGALETVVAGKSGLLFKEQTPTAIIEAINRFEQAEHLFDSHTIASLASRFDKTVFKDKLSQFIQLHINPLL